MNLKVVLRPTLIAFAVFIPAAMVLAGDNVVIVLDDSGSMNERMAGGVRRIDAAKRAIAQVIKQFPADTKLGLMLLNGEKAKQHWAIPLEHLSLVQATRRVEAVKADGGTPLGERMKEGAEALLQLRDKEIYGNYRLLIVTDGEASDKKQLDLYLPDVLSRGLLVDAIGVDMRKDHSLATRVHSYRRADDAAALSKAVEEVFAEKVDAGSANDEADFALLQAMDDSMAKEALSALAKPNNATIIGFSLQNRIREAEANNASANPTSAPSTNAGPTNSGPNNASPPNAPNVNVSTRAGVGIVTILLAIASCICPLLLVIMAILSVLSKTKGGRGQR